MLEDLERGYEQLKQGKEIDLGSKTTSFQQWGERLQEYGREEKVGQELEYWSSEARRRVKRLGLDYKGNRGENLIATQKSVLVELEAEETRALLQDVPSAYNTQINDVLLTALGRAMEEWQGNDGVLSESVRGEGMLGGGVLGEGVLVDLEGHGREEIFADMDVSRTVMDGKRSLPIWMCRGRWDGSAVRTRCYWRGAEEDRGSRARR